MRKWLATLTATIAVAAGSIVASTSASALPLAPEPVLPVTGIPVPCATTHEYPADSSIEEIQAQLTANYGFKLAGSQWTDERRPSIKILWETLDAMECTTYRTDLLAKQGGNVGINAASISGYAWGDWSLTRTSYVTLDFSKFQRALDSGDEGRLTRLVAHELAHVRNSDRFENPEYWQVFKELYAREGRFSNYAGSKITETFADVVGYYVGRCALDNPYDTGEHDAYYDYAKTYIFGGKEFGPAPGATPDCALPAEGAEEPLPGEDAPLWLEGLAGE
ncbi:hypothetical protein [Tessaracoccus flavus]|uniref:Uncharacterized protein n=1 Tax=Tessaracoccus flavus TaxID=1610493 RepID=A0A1Q2CI90_9ACTN|nr:hypothetical protein [Tessaracoccus flavus]AQP45814.1 hypothetical protein RPIT_14210 [Tessaracoccus flavus]SDZ14642.1 hypothetical protein SAMN05428934_11224 [Tessaracoccus flavus]